MARFQGLRLFSNPVDPYVSGRNCTKLLNLSFWSLKL